MKTSKTTILEKVSMGVELTPSEVSYLQSVLADTAEPTELAKSVELNIEFDHTKNDFYSACGISQEIVEEKNVQIRSAAMKIAMKEMMEGKPGMSASKLTEAILENADQDLIKFLCVNAIYEKFSG